LLLIAVGLLNIAALAAPPVVSNIRAAQRAGTHYVDIWYNVTDPDGNSPLTVYAHISADAGTTWNVPVFTLRGHVGPGVAPGNDRHIVWNAGTDWPGQFNNQCKVRIVADDNTAPVVPVGMAYIPGGVFQMGDSLGDAGTFSSERPVHNVFISSFFMDKNFVTGDLWGQVTTWSDANGMGYSFAAGSFKASGHPVHTVSWFDVVKWCNARSQMAGLTPCYYTDVGLANIYKSGESAPYVKWSANGYRLPTEAEWEKAARGAPTGKRFPWGDTISHALANCFAGGGESYDLSKAANYHPKYATGQSPYTSPVGAFSPNGYGLFDMAGNLWEWCWDWWSENWYANTQAIRDDTRGPTSGGARVLRGGAWDNFALSARCASRFSDSPSSADNSVGFRCVRGL
jgi:formylglycine-generating enzyme required for sulfatase activity